MIELKKVKIKRIDNLMVGDIIFNICKDEDSESKKVYVGIVTGLGETTLHHHSYARVRWEDNSVANIMQDQLSDEEFVWRKK